VTPALERDAEDRFVTWIESLGFEAWKLRIDGRDGFPDRTVVTDRGTIYFEFKRLRGKVRPQQRKVIKRLTEIGAPVFVVHSLKEAKEIFNEWYGSTDDPDGNRERRDA
jgi:hypothetical protein